MTIATIIFIMFAGMIIVFATAQAVINIFGFFWSHAFSIIFWTAAVIAMFVIEMSSKGHI